LERFFFLCVVLYLSATGYRYFVYPYVTNFVSAPDSPWRHIFYDYFLWILAILQECTHRIHSRLT